MGWNKLANVIKWFLTYRQGLLVLIVANIYLLLFIPFSWLYYDIRYYYEWVDITWSKGFVFIINRFHSSLLPEIIVIPRGILYIYVYATKASYPPLPIWLFVTTHSIAVSLTNTLQLIRLIDKLPLVIVFNIIYFYLRKNYDWKTGLLWLISHFSYITIFSYHVDLFTALFLLLGFTEYVRRKNIVKSAIYTALAGVFKPLAVVVALVLLTIMFKKHMYKEIILYITTGFIVGLAIVFPYLCVSPSLFMYKAFFFHMNRYPQEYSIWAIPVYLVNYDITRLPIWIKYIWSPIYIVVLIYVLYMLWNVKEVSEKILVKYYILVLLITLLLNKVGNINYFIWVLPFLTIYATYVKLYRDTLFSTLYIFISFIMVIIAPFTTFYTAFVVQGSIYIIEDLSYYSASDLASRSFDPTTIQYVLAEYLRTNMYWFFSIMYMGINLSYVIYASLYNLYLMYIVLKVIRS